MKRGGERWIPESSVIFCVYVCLSSKSMYSNGIKEIPIHSSKSLPKTIWNIFFLSFGSFCFDGEFVCVCVCAVWVPKIKHKHNTKQSNVCFNLTNYIGEKKLAATITSRHTYPPSLSLFSFSSHISVIRFNLWLYFSIVLHINQSVQMPHYCRYIKWLSCEETINFAHVTLLLLFFFTRVYYLLHSCYCFIVPKASETRAHTKKQQQ